jgi:hypothetical protein
MDLSERLGSLTATELAPVVRRAVGEEDAWPRSWQIESLGWAAVNPATLGLFRLTGSATLGSRGQVDWAVVLKVVGHVDLAGTPLEVGFLHDPQDWNYWRREADAFASGLLDGWPGPLLPVRCLGVDETEQDVTWIWLEAQDGAHERVWTLEEQAVLAYDLGAFAAQWSDDPPSTVDYPWLAQRWLRGGMTSLRAGGVDHALAHDGCWRHPLLSALPADTRERVGRLVGGAERLLAVLESLPTTMAHHDTQASNFFIRDPADVDGRTVAIDWGFLGLSPVGHDLGCHLWSNIATWTVDPLEAAELDTGSTSAYLRGLRDFGWEGDENAVLFARATAAALATTTMLTLQISGLCDQTPHFLSDGAWPQELADQKQLSVETVMTRWAAGLDYVLDLGDEAHRLSRSLGNPSCPP